jgi:hypothetical protein
MDYVDMDYGLWNITDACVIQNRERSKRSLEEKNQNTLIFGIN